MTGKKMSIAALCITLALLLLIGGITVFMDPFFHYFGPRDSINYRLYNQRYQNDGITRHFEYDAIITGTSMIENFKTSECDALFGTNSIKIPFSGASYKELNETLERALVYNDQVSVIFRGIDLGRLFSDKDYMRYESYPDYLYDEHLLNDVSYLFNKDLFVDDVIGAIEFDMHSDTSHTFDRYSNWQNKHTYGKEAVLAEYERPKASEKIREFSAEDEEVVRGNIRQNVTDLVEANPQITFYLFMPPYSIVYWDSLNQEGKVQRAIDGQRVAIEMILQYDNVRLFGFFDEFDLICDLNQYRDDIHYGEQINTQMLEWMHDGEHELTLDNYEAYIQALSDFYTTYPYESIFETE